MKGTKDKKTIERLLSKVAILQEAALNVVCPDPENAVGDNDRNWTILEQLTANAAFETSHYIYQCRKDQEAKTKAACINAVCDCWAYTDEFGGSVYDSDLGDTINAVNTVTGSKETHAGADR